MTDLYSFYYRRAEFSIATQKFTGANHIPIVVLATDATAALQKAQYLEATREGHQWVFYLERIEYYRDAKAELDRLKQGMLN